MKCIQLSHYVVPHVVNGGLPCEISAMNRNNTSKKETKVKALGINERQRIVTSKEQGRMQNWRLVSGASNTA